MIKLSTEFKVAFKTALAMVIAYYIALSNDWAQPAWAAYSIVILGQARAGSTILKGASRVAGTVVAAIIGLVIISLFLQDCWLFMLALSIYLGVCVYMMTGKTNKYFYSVSGFVCVIICFNSGFNSVNSFQMATMRVLETGMGVAVYTLINILIWPVNSYTELKKITDKIAVSFTDINSLCFQHTTSGTDKPESVINLADTEIMLDEFAIILDEAKVDTTDVNKNSRLWDSLEVSFKEIYNDFVLWREDLPEIQSVDIGKFFINIVHVREEFELRFTQIERILANKKFEHVPHPLKIILNKDLLGSLSLIDRSKVMLLEKHLDRINKHTMSLFEFVHDLKVPSNKSVIRKPRLPAPYLDIDRVFAALGVISTMWLSFIIYIYLDVPGGISFVLLSTVFGMFILTNPQMTTRDLYKPVFIGLATTIPINIFVLPQLNFFGDLAILLFVYTFITAYILYKPKYILTRTFILVVFISTSAITNTQVHSLPRMLVVSLMFIFIMFLIGVVDNFPISSRPEKRVLRLVRRFYKYADFLASYVDIRSYGELSRFQRWRMIAISKSLVGIPHKLEIWIGQIKPNVFAEDLPQRLNLLNATLQALAYQLQLLLYISSKDQSVRLLREYHNEMLAWTKIVRGGFNNYTNNMSSEEFAEVRFELVGFTERIQQQIEEAINEKKDAIMLDSDYVDIYRLLACIQGVTRSVVNSQAAVRRVKWNLLENTRF